MGSSESPGSSAAPSSGLNIPGAEFLLRYGGITLVVASAVFFVSTAISRGWIGPTAQLVAATLTSLLIVGQSFRFNEDQRPWTITLAIGGTAALFASGVVGFIGLEILSFTAAISWLLASVGLFLVLARLHDAQSIAVASVPAAFAGAFLLFEGEWYEPLWLCLVGASYIVAVAATTHGRSWFIARAAGVSTGAFLAGSAVLDTIFSDANSHLAILGAMSVVAVAIGAASQAWEFHSQEDSEKPRTSALIEARFAALTIPYIAAVVAGVATELNVIAIDTLWVGAGVAALLGGSVFALRRLPETMRLLHFGAALATISVSLIGVADGPVLLVALLGQAAIAGWLARRFDSPDMLVLASLFAAAVSALTVGYLFFGAVVEGLTTAESVAVLLVVIASGVAAKALRESTRFDEAWFVTWFLAMSWAVASFRDVSQGQMIITLVWAMLGAAMLMLASRLLDRQMLSAGLFTLTLTAGKLIFVDLVAVDVLWRAGLFFVVGMLFMRLAFVLPKLMDGPATPGSNSLLDPPVGPAPESELANSGSGLG